MEKLTKKQVQFIDDRLYNLGVEFMDIRYEMLDHIASELEGMDGDFGDNWHEYFIMHRIQLIKQNKNAKKAAIVRAIKLYFKTMAMPLVSVSAILMAVSVYYGSFYVEDDDINFLGMGILILLLFPMMWFGRKNQKLSVMRPLVLIHTVIYTMYQFGEIISYSAESDEQMFLIRRIIVSVMPAFMLVLAVSLYQCRKQYVGKYI